VRLRVSNSISNCVLGWTAAGAVIVSLCLWLGYLPLLQPDEGRNAEIAHEMLDSGAWLVPTYNGLDRLDKPAFYFKTVALSLSLFGKNETAARLPSALAGVALVTLTFIFARRVFDTRTGLLAAAVVATTPLYIANARTVILDMQLALFVSGAIFAGFVAETKEGKPRRNWYLVGAALAGCATLVKGPVGFLIPLLALAVFNRLESRVGAFGRMLAPVNLLVFLGITLPWFIGLCLVHPDFLRYGLVEESFQRFASARAFHRAQPFYYYIPVVALTFFPWSLLLPGAAVATLKKRWNTTAADRLCIVWALVTLAFFSVSSSKLPGYTLSVTVPSGVLVARLFSAALAAREGRAARLVRWAIGGLAAICLLLAIITVVGRSHAELLAKPLRIAATEAGQLKEAAVPISIALAALASLASMAWIRRQPVLAFFSMTLFSPLLVTTGVPAFKVIYEAKSCKALAQILLTVPANAEFACLQCMPVGLPFYLHRNAVLISRDGHELASNYISDYLRRNPWPRTKVVPLPEFDSWLSSRKTPVYVLAPPAERPRLEVIAKLRNCPLQNLPQGFIGVLLPVRDGG
jgi:4-amino-4-deoxy-L-arabinose transferase-like glycosyltransferase